MRQLIAILLLALALPAQAATKLHATTTASLLPELSGPWGGMGCRANSVPALWEYLSLSTTAPSSATSDGFVPIATAPPCNWQRASPSNGGRFLAFVSPPVNSGVTISGDISGVCSALESNGALAAGCRLELWKWDGQRGGLTAKLWTGNTAVEVATGSCAAASISASAPTCTGPGCASSSSAVLATGDRLVVIPIAIGCTNSCGSWGGNNSRTLSLCYNGANGGTNEVSVTITENPTFSADSGATRVESVRGD